MSFYSSWVMANRKINYWNWNCFFFFRCCLLCFSFWLWILFCRFTLFFQVLIFHLLAFRYLKHRKIPAAEGKKPTICSIFKCQMISSCDLFCVENFIDVSFFRFFEVYNVYLIFFSLIHWNRSLWFILKFYKFC